MEDSSKLKVVLSSVPQECKLKWIKDEILAILQEADDFAVRAINRCKDLNGKIIPGKLEVELSSVEGKRY